MCAVLGQDNDARSVDNALAWLDDYDQHPWCPLVWGKRVRILDDQGHCCGRLYYPGYC